MSSSRDVVRDSLLLGLTARCPECGKPMTPLGHMYRMHGTSRWHVAFESDCRPDEEFGLWEPGYQPIIDKVLAAR